MISDTFKHNLTQYTREHSQQYIYHLTHLRLIFLYLVHNTFIYHCVLSS